MIQAVSAKVGIDPVPTSVFSDSGRTAIELRETANECAAQIVRDYDWSAMMKVAQITGDGLTSQFVLSTLIPDFQRMIKNAELWTDSQTYGNLKHIDSLNDWLQQENWSIGWTGGAWTMYGGSLYIRAGSTNALTDDQTVRFGYISGFFAKTPANVFKDSFTADTDSFALNERLLKLCMIWNWKSAHGQPYAQEFDDYEVLLEQTKVADKTPSIIRSGRRVPPYYPMGFR